MKSRWLIILGLIALLWFPFSMEVSLYFLLTLFVVFFVKNNGPVLLFSILGFSIATSFLLEVNGIKTTYYSEYYSEKNYSEVYLGFLWFSVIFLSGLNGLQLRRSRILNNVNKTNFIFFMAIGAQCFLLLFGKSGETLAVAGYGKLKIQSLFGMSLNEYYLIFAFITLFIYKPNRIVHLINILYIAKNFSFGGRVETLQLIFAYTIYLKFDFKSMKAAILCASILVSFWVISTVRSKGFSAGTVEETLGQMKLFDLEFIQSSASTFSEVIYSSSVMQGVRQDGLISPGNRSEILSSHVLSYIFPHSLIDEKANIIKRVQTISPCGGGSLPSAYFYFLGGIPLVIFGSGIYVLFWRKVMSSESSILNSLALIILITMPRWILYNHITFFKSAFYLFLVLLAMKKFKDHIARRKVG